MSAPITNLQAAQRDAIMNRPAVNGFPHLAETLRRAGVEPIPGGYRRCKACTRLITVQSLTKACP